ncbi:MAG: PorT family protein [Paludibacteraceae bacterium]|nr:PorT family protein [Paludibacteraceae bacterium]
MKKILTIIITAFICITGASAQESFTTYRNSYHGFDNPVFMSLTHQNFTLWISGLPVGREVQTGGMAIKESQYQVFYEGLNFAKQAYLEWKKDLQSGKRKKLNKSLRMFVNSDAFFKTNDWYYDFNLMLKFDLIAEITEDSSAYYLVIGTGKLRSSLYSTISSDGFEIVFSNENEITQFMESISRKRINEQIVFMNPASERIKQQITEKRIQKIEKHPWLSSIEYGVTAAFSSSFKMNAKPAETSEALSLIDPMTNYHKTFSGGIFARVYYRNFLFQPEILYNGGSGENFFSFFDRSLQQIIIKKETSFKTLEVPILLGYNFVNIDKFRVSIAAGPQFSFDMGSGSRIAYYHTWGSYDLSSESETMNAFRTGITAAAMFDYGRFSLGIRYNYFANKFETTFDSRLFDKMATPSLSFTAAWKIFEPIK